MDCPHLRDSVKINREFFSKLKKCDSTASLKPTDTPDAVPATITTLSQQFVWRCIVCSSNKENWMCLHCGAILCGRYENSHALNHSTDKPEHTVCFNTLNYSVFCYICDDYVTNETNTLHDLRQEFRKHFDDDTSSEASTIQSESSSSKSIQETASTSSNDSGWADEPATSSNRVTTTTTTKSGRKLRPRKRTHSNDSNVDPVKRKQLKKVVGLRNLGNTCFMNSVLQSLSNIQEFSCYFNTLPSLEPNGKQQKRTYHSRSLKENVNDANVVEELRKVLTNLSHGGDGSKAISPECLFLVIWKVVPQFRGHRQHDAHEFLRYMLDRLHTELQHVSVSNGVVSSASANDHTETSAGKLGNKYKYYSIGGGSTSTDTPTNSIMFKGRSSIVTNVFGGTLQSEVRCLICGMESKKHDPFLDLSLDIPEKFYKDIDDDSGPSTCNISDCLSSFTEIEELAETELYYCNSCKCKQKSTKRFWIRRLPNVLCLHIKRFRWNNFFRTKIDLRITFPIKSLDMSQFVLNNGPETRRSHTGSNVYDLAAVIVHHGNGSSCGHYTSFANHNGTWLHFNDHTVKEVQMSAVAECKPYILFYIRRDLNKTL